MSWEIVEDLSSKFNEGDAVIIDPTLASTLKFPVKIMTGADVYPIAEDMREQIARLEAEHEEVYYITTKEWFLFKNYDIDNIYSGVSEVWYDLTESVDGKQLGGINPFPDKFTKEIQMVNVYRCHSNLD